MGWFASFLLLTGAYLVGLRRRSGFVLQLIGNLLWAVIGCYSGMYDLMFVETCFCLVNVWSFHNWRPAKPSQIGKLPVYFDSW